MTRSFRLCAVPCLLIIGIVTACQPSQEEVIEPDKPAIAFKGKKDKRLFGTWKSHDGRSTYNFTSDGKYNLSSKVSTPGGPQESKLDGTWLVDGDNFLMRNDQGYVIPYNMKLTLNDLELVSTGSMRSKTLLKRAK